MRYMKPVYFDDFSCIADKCPDTCCAGWQIVIDEAALEVYAQDKSSFAHRLSQGIDWQEGCFVQYHKRCSMLNEQNLCDMVIQKGEEWLCETCRRYPRHVEEFDGIREWSLSLSCPAAAEMMLNRKEALSFVVEEDEKEDPLEAEFEDFDFLLFTQLEDARTVLFSIVQNRNIPMEERLVIILEMAKELQKCVDEERMYDMEEVIRSFSGKTIDYVVEYGQERFEKLKKNFEVLSNLERLREEWTTVLENARTILYSQDYEAYCRIYQAFCKEYIHDNKEDWEIFEEQIVMFFLYTYFCGAVYDDCIYSKVALAVFSVSFIQEFVMCDWYLADKYIDKQECIRMAYRYAREVEHSDDNLNALEEWLLETM